MSKLKQYTLDELHIGMEIQDKSQLSNIYDIWIILYKKSDSQPYKIGFIGEHTTTESDKLYSDNIICPVYNDSIEIEEDIYFEE